MRLRVPVVILTAALAMGAIVSAAPAQKQPSAAEVELKARIEKVWAGWETLDPANAAPYYSKDADHVFFDIAPLKYTGWAEYAEGAKKLLAQYASMKFTLGADLRIHLHGRLAWVTASWRGDGVTKGGAKETFDGRWTAIWEKRGKEWFIVHDHFSVPLPMADTAAQPLYKRLGGYDAIAAVVDDFIGRLVADRQLARFFTGASNDSKKRTRQLIVDQLCAATGGPCFYTGRSMKVSHEGLGITESDWQAAAKHLVATLEKFNVPPREKQEVLSAISGMKGDIVTAR